jgi:hypothetical protein
VQSLLLHEEHIREYAAMLASRAKVSKEAMLQKILAVRWAATNGFTSQDIIANGQSRILTAYRKARRNGSEDPQRLLAWRVSKGLADAIQCEDPSPDQDEPIVNRIARLLHLERSEELWTFWHSVFVDLTDEQILHLGGEYLEKKQKIAKRS